MDFFLSPALFRLRGIASRTDASASPGIQAPTPTSRNRRGRGWSAPSRPPMLSLSNRLFADIGKATVFLVRNSCSPAIAAGAWRQDGTRHNRPSPSRPARDRRYQPRGEGASPAPMLLDCSMKPHGPGFLQSQIRCGLGSESCGPAASRLRPKTIRERRLVDVPRACIDRHLIKIGAS